jgi:hypothetical protein
MDEQVERHESKQDVFEAVMCDYDEVLGCAVDHGYYGDALTAGEYRARYAGAGKVAVPREVGEYIDNHYGMFTIFGAMRMAIEKIDTPLDDLNQTKYHWIANHLDTFARAWLDGWYAESGDDNG